MNAGRWKFCVLGPGIIRREYNLGHCRCLHRATPSQQRASWQACAGTLVECCGGSPRSAFNQNAGPGGWLTESQNHFFGRHAIGRNYPMIVQVECSGDHRIADMLFVCTTMAAIAGFSTPDKELSSRADPNPACACFWERFPAAPRSQTSLLGPHVSEPQRSL